MKRILFSLIALLCVACAKADDSIWLYKKAFVETYHIDRNCPRIVGKKLLAFSLSDETETRQKMRTAIQLADNCPVCHTPNIRGTRDNRLDQLLADVLGTSLSYDFDDEDSTAVSEMTFTDTSLFDDEVVLGLPEDDKATSSIYRHRGHRFKMLEVRKAVDERLVGAKVTCEIINSRKSNIMGTEGYLSFRPLFLTAEDGTIVRMKPTEFMVRGRNRQCLKVLLFFCPPVWFVPGEGAKIRPEDEFIATLDLSADTSADGIAKQEAQKKAEAEAQRARLEAALKGGKTEGESEEGEKKETEEEKAAKAAESAKAREDVRKLLGL